MKERTSLWEKIAERDLYEILLEMGDSKASIEKYQRSRILQVILILIIGCTVAYLLSPIVYIISVVMAIFLYRSKYKRVKSFYQKWKFERQLQFSKFCRLLIPYLKQNNGQVSLYSVFNKLLNRLDNETDKQSLYRLMTEMSRNPSDIKPFIDFANRSSGSDNSIIFMSALFDFQQETADIQGIEELGTMANEDLMKGIDEIINFKLRKFNMYPTKLAMTPIILILGYVAAVIIYSVSGINFEF